MGHETSTSRRIPRVIALGFALLLVLTALILSISLTRMSAILDEMDSIISNHHRKADIINNMHKIVSERSLYTYIMYFSEDPFERDQLYLRYHDLAANFVSLREQLEQLPFSPAERKALEATFEIIRKSQPLQDSIVEQIRDENLDGLKQRILSFEWPQEQVLYDRFNAIVAMEQASASASMQKADGEYTQALYMMLGLSGTVLFAGVAIALAVITRIKRIEGDLFKEKELARFTLESMSDAVITTDLQLRVVYANPVAEKMLGQSESDMKGQRLESLFSVVNGDDEEIEIRKLSRGATGNIVDFRNASLRPTSTDTQFLVEGNAAVTHDDHGETLGVALVIRDVSEARHLANQLSWQASHDSLTGLVNRREFERILKQLLSNTRIEGKTHAALYIDLDQFKIVNDTCGHSAGDKLLQQVSALLQKEVRSSDTLARLGGDEFGLLLEACPLPKAEQIALEILSLIQGFRFSWHSRIFKIGASIGVVAVDENSESLAQIMSAADAACYVAKDKGRNRVWVHYPDDKEIAKRHGEMELTGRINGALEADRFVIYKQRIQPIRKNDRKVIYEILVRMIDEDGRELMPMSFIPAAERYGIMPQVDRLVIRETLRKLATKDEPYRDIDLVTINISAQSLSDDLFLQYVIDRIDDSGIEPERLCFEITETTAIANWIRVTRFISMLRGMGCKFALDDFGSGMSSFTYLRNLAVDYIKIDGSFVRNIDIDQINRAMVEAIHTIGRVMGIGTIAEFIENDIVLEELERIGVDYAQGYAIHKPEPF